jgi:N-acetylmuramoyl-L-alanine amidase
VLGDRGDAVRDLQRRLALAGFAPSSATLGVLCQSTQESLEQFQTARGLRATGICDQTTWLALVEAGWGLGDRLLKLTSPNVRGDDVSALQAELCRLGFDAGRVDGIFGSRTASALLEFQRSCGMSGDGICGPETLRFLDRLGRQSGHGPGVSALKETERLRDLSKLVDCRIVVGQFGGLSSLARPLARFLRVKGAEVILVDEPDASAQADAANRFAAHAYVGLEAAIDAESSFFYYRVPEFESVAGKALAQSLADYTSQTLLSPPRIEGIRLPVLRETRMPAVLCRLGPVRSVADDAPRIAWSCATSLQRWVESTPQPH